MSKVSKPGVKKTAVLSHIILLMSIGITSCAFEQEDSFTETKAEDLKKIEAAVVNGFGAADVYTGIVRLGSYNASPPSTQWDWFCTGTLITNDVVLTAKHCVTDSALNPGGPDFTANPTLLEVHMRGAVYPFRKVERIKIPADTGVSGWFDIAFLYLKSPYQMYKVGTNQLSTSGYYRPWDITPLPDLIGEIALCAGMSGMPNNHDRSSTYLTADAFSIVAAPEIPGSGSFGDLVLQNPGLWVGGYADLGDSGGPCFYQMDPNVRPSEWTMITFMSSGGGSGSTRFNTQSPLYPLYAFETEWLEFP